jgi:hypothetical protein
VGFNWHYSPGYRDISVLPVLSASENFDTEKGRIDLKIRKNAGKTSCISSCHKNKIL